MTVNQHSVGCHKSKWPCACGLEKKVQGSQSEMGSFDFMMQLLMESDPDFRQVVAFRVPDSAK